MVCGKIDAPLEDISVHGAGGTLVLAGDNLHPVAAAESVVETHALEGIDWTVLAQETAVGPSTKTSTKELMSPDVWWNSAWNYGR